MSRRTWPRQRLAIAPRATIALSVTYRREIDGLRAIALLPVLLFHAGFSWFRGGFVGVDVFFVISGYLITSIILSETQSGSFSIARFYERRTRRILPALFVVMLACLPFAWLWMLPEDLRGFGESLLAVAGFGSNLLFFLTSGYFDTAAELKPLLHTWSLAVEEQYYILFPLLVMLMWHWGRRVLAVTLSTLGLISFVIAVYSVREHSAFAFYLLPARAWELMIGASLAALPVRQRASWLFELAGIAGLALIAAAVALFDRTTPFPGIAALLPTVGTALLIACASPTTLSGRLLGSRPLVGIGLISYSAYLWHQPLLAFARHRSIGHPPPLLLAGLLIMSMLLAWATWAWVEAPARNRQRVPISRLAWTLCAAWLAIVTAGASTIVADGYPDRVPEDVKRIANAARDRSPRQPECLVFQPIEPANACVLGNPSRIVGTLVGDSQAAALGGALESAMAQRGLGLRQLTFQGCPPVLGVSRPGVPGCTVHNERVAASLVPGSTVILLARWTLYLTTTRFDNLEGGVEPGDPVETTGPLALRMQETVRGYLRRGVRVVLVYPVPEAGWNVPSDAAKRRWFAADARDLTTSRTAFTARNADTVSALDAIGEHSLLVRVYAEEVFCSGERCVAQRGGVPLYYDAVHLSNAGASMLVEAITRVLR
jgi:peptidoglycan/LPS O-acetylase OafA/YrhL